MARGNDRAAALVDLRGEYGSASGNAEDLIQAGRHAMTPELRHASLLQRDEEATGELLDDFDANAKKIDAEGNVVDLAVRGDYVVAVVETDTGRTYKVAQPKSDFGLKPRRRGAVVGQAPEVPEPEGERDVRERHEERLQAAADAARLEKEAEKAAAEARAKAADRGRSDKTEGKAEKAEKA